MSRKQDIEMLVAFQTTSLTLTSALLVLASGDAARIDKMRERLSLELAVALALTDEIISSIGTSSYEQTYRLQQAIDRVRESVPEELASGTVEMNRMIAKARATQDPQ
jgi:hypothetical protein